MLWLADTAALKMEPSLKNYSIAVYPGDGIGVDVTDAAMCVLDAVAQADGSFSLDQTRFDWGADYFDKHGKPAPDDLLDTVRPFNAIFLGAVGYPSRYPDHVSLIPLVTIRQKFDLYSCVRPARTYQGVRSLLASNATIDMAVVRENSEGEYFTCGGRFKQGSDDEIAIQTGLHSRKGIERILRFGFDLARTRRNKLTMITKSNAMKFSMVMWDNVLEQVQGDYPDVETDKQHVDAAAMNFVRMPEKFDVVVASNLFGDILTDLSGAIVGSLGLNPSANLDPTRQFPSLFEPVHGSAPDIAGKGIANPVGAILSGAMMLDWLGEKEAAARIQTAVEQSFAQGCLTPDVGGDLTTDQMTEAVLERLGVAVGN